MQEDFPAPPGFDCQWLTRAFATRIPIKLMPAKKDNRRPYHFLETFTDDNLDNPHLMVRVLDRKKERTFSLEDLRWMPASDINQTVIRTTGEDGSTLFWTIRIDGDDCEVRKVPSKRGAPSYIMSRLQLAQVNSKR